MNSPDTAVTLSPETVGRTRPNAAVLALQAAFREDRFFLMLSVFIGIFAGLIVVCFRLAIDWCNIFLLGPVPHAYSVRLLIAPVVVSFVVAVLVLHVFRGVRGSGVNQTKAALYISNGLIPLRTSIGKLITATLAIGSGH